MILINCVMEKGIIMKIHVFLILIGLSTLCCSSYIPKKDNIHNNCIVFKMISKDVMKDDFSWVNLVGENGSIYKAFPLDSWSGSGAYNYYLFNVPSGKYYVDSAVKINEEDVPISPSPLSPKGLYSSSTVTHSWKFIFSNDVKETLVFSIEDNQFKFMGTAFFSNTSPLDKRVLPARTDGTAENTIELISWDNKVVKESYSVLLKVFKKTFWEKEILEEMMLY
jgi:hypothetical protein